MSTAPQPHSSQPEHAGPPVVAPAGGASPNVVAGYPLLSNGDRMTREEFHRRYLLMPELKKAELIDGVVYTGSPVRAKYHGIQDSHMSTWVGTYRAATPGVSSATNSTLILKGQEVQPDVLLRIERGGTSQIDAEGYVVGAPELVVEISASSASYDLHAKKDLFQRSGVQEYIVWRVIDSAIDWFVLVDSQYVPIMPDEEGVVRSRTFPGLWLDVPAMLRLDLAAALARLQTGLASDEHREFVSSLSKS